MAIHFILLLFVAASTVVFWMRPRRTDSDEKPLWGRLAACGRLAIGLRCFESVGQVAYLRTDCLSVHPGAARTP